MVSEPGHQASVVNKHQYGVCNQIGSSFVPGEQDLINDGQKLSRGQRWLTIDLGIDHDAE